MTRGGSLPDAAARSVEECPHRIPLETAADRAEASCGLLGEISGLPLRHVAVSQAACEACSADREPSEEDLNPTVASLLWSLAGRIAEAGGLDGCTPARAADLKRTAARHMHRVMTPRMAEDYTSQSYEGRCFHQGGELAGDGPGRWMCLHERHDEGTTIEACKACFDYDTGLVLGTVRQWVVGMTTAPRQEQTIEVSLRSLGAAGWSDPHVFAEPGSSLPDWVRAEDVTTRAQSMGAWPNWLLGLTELYLRFPHADAYLMVQDDVVYPLGLREYLEEVLWPARRLGLVALHTASHWEQARTPGFYPTAPGWQAWGAQVYAIPNAGVRSLLRNRRVQNHRHRGPNDGRQNVDSVLGMWCRDTGLPYYLHTPSLSQHIGETSTLWGPAATTAGRRRATTFLGEDVDIGEWLDEALRRRDLKGPLESLALVCVLVGERAPFEDWKAWMLESDLPVEASLYLVDNSADEDFTAMLEEAAGIFSGSGRFRRITPLRGDGPAAERRLSEGRCRNIAAALNLALAATTEDMVMVLDCDTVPPRDAVPLLAGELGREGCAFVSGCYESANYRGHLAAARALREWRDRPAVGELGKSEIIDVGYAGTGCALLHGRIVRGLPPLRARGEDSGALGHDSWLCEQLRRAGHRIRLHGGVQCRHWIPATTPGRRPT